MTFPPVPLGPEHDCTAFDCGEPMLDDWLKKHALANQRSGASRTFVVTDAEGRVLAYYALAAGAVDHAEATGAIRRNMPDPIPVMVLGRLAVDHHQQGRKLGASLLKDAVLRCLDMASIYHGSATLSSPAADRSTRTSRRNRPCPRSAPNGRPNRQLRCRKPAWPSADR